MFKTDSRLIKKGDTFIAIKGILKDGHDYIEDAITKGAKKIICEHGNGTIVKDTKKYLRDYLTRYYYPKIKHIKLIGITGTNGKTTTSYLIYQVLNQLGIKCAYIGTLGFYKNGNHYSLDNTTPNLVQLYNLLLDCRDCEYVVMEVSSQGLSYGRVDTLKFSYAIFTNLTQDHLDYHKTMENYCLAKQKLFHMLNKDGIGIVNKDSSYYKYFKTDNMITYGMKKSDYQLIDYKIDINGSKFILNKRKYKTNLVGKHNIYNIICVIIILKCLNIKNKKIYKSIKNINNVPGRMDKIKYNNNLIIIDYAHTPDAVDKIIKSVSKLADRVITIVGCGGNRDKEKRPLMGKIATSLSNYVIFTSDNPRFEKSEDILNDIVNKLDTFNYKIEVDRKIAIKKGIQMLEKNDILLILGKGHEDYQIIGNKKYHFSDQEEVLKVIGR